MYTMPRALQIMTSIVSFVLCVCAVIFFLAGAARAQDSEQEDIGIIMTVSTSAGDTRITGTLDVGNPTARDFMATLPRTMTMTRWDDREYYGKVGKPLSDAAPQQSGYADGDITYYVPGGSYAVFFAKGGKSPISNFIILGKVTSDLNMLDTLENTVEMRISIAE